MLLALVLGACASSGSPFDGMDADAVYVAGLQAYHDEDWDTAISAFSRVLSSSPGFAQAPEARYYLGRSHFEKGEYLTAATEWDIFLVRHPNHGRAPEASLGVCRSYARLAPHPQRDQQHTQRALEKCRETRTEFQGTNVAEEAESLREEMVERLAEREFQIARWYQRHNLHDSAIILFQQLVDFYPQTSWAPRGFLGLYRSYVAIGWSEEAEEVRDRLLFLYPDTEAAAELRADDDRSPQNGGGAAAR